MPKTKLATAVKPRKKNPPRTAFKRGEPNPHAFQPGSGSPNPGGKPRPELDKILSRALRERLNTRAPDATCASCQVPHHSSWAQCLAAIIVRKASTEAAFLQLLLSYTEGLPKASLALDSNISGDMPEGGDCIIVNFVASSHPEAATLNVVETPPDHMPPPLIEAKLLPEPDPPPTATPRPRPVQSRDPRLDPNSPWFVGRKPKS